MRRLALSLLAPLLAVAVSARAQSTDTTLEVVSWNIEWFGATGNGPANKDLQESNVGKILKWMDADLYGLVEVVDTMRLRRVVDVLGADRFGFVISPYCSNATQPSGNAWLSGQKLAFVYRKSVFSNVTTRGLMRSSATANTSWATGRFPFMMSARVTIQGLSRDMNFILIHAKSGSTESDYLRRLAGAQELKDTLDAQLPTATNLIIGDFNDALEKTIYTGAAESSFRPIVMDSTDADHYRSITLPLGKSGQSSMINFPNMVDNHVISNEAASIFIKGSVKVVTDLTSQVPDYATARNTSDHYPIWSRYDLGGDVLTALPSLTFADAGIRMGPNPTTDRVFLRTEKFRRDVEVSLLDFAGRLVWHRRLARWQAGEVVSIPLISQPRGTYRLQLVSEKARFTETIVKH